MITYCFEIEKAEGVKNCLFAQFNFSGMVALVLGEEGRNERWARAVPERLPRNALQKMEYPAVTVGRGVEKLKQKGPSFDEPKWRSGRDLNPRPPA